MSTRLLSVGTALPAHVHPQADITDAFARVVVAQGASARLQRSVHGNAGVEQRHIPHPLGK